MDWIKVKTNHILYEYTDLSDSEFRAWIKLMALTANLEHEPTHEQMLKEVHHKTLTSLQDKLKTRSIDLQYILNKVLIDAQEVANRKRYWKDKKKEYRASKENVHEDIQETSKCRLDKEKEIDKDKNKTKPQKIAFVIPDWIKKETWEAYREMRRSKRAPLTDRAAALIVKELEKLKAQGNDPERVLNQSIMKSWTGVFPLGNDNQAKRNPYTPVDHRPTPPEWKGDDLPVIGEEERQRNLEKIKKITGGIG